MLMLVYQVLVKIRKRQLVFILMPCHFSTVRTCKLGAAGVFADFKAIETDAVCDAHGAEFRVWTGDGHAVC